MSGHASTARGLMIVTALLLLAGTATEGQRWTPARTPWGDPDLQGDYSNKYEQGTPFERPAEFEGRRLEDIKGGELAALVRERATEVLLNAPFTGGDPVAGNFGGAPAFYDRFEAGKGSRPWLVVDPPDGKVPAMSPEGRQASAARAAARAALRRGRGPADSYEDRSLYDRCITRGLPGSMMPTNYGNSYRIVQAPGHVAITYEMVHETRIIPLDGRAPLARSIRQYMGDARGHWDGDTLVVETTNFRDEPAYRGSNPDALRLIERFTAISARQGRVVRHGRRSNDMDEAVDVRDAADPERQGGRCRVRVPRGQPGDVAPARRRAGGRERRTYEHTHRGHSFDGTAHPHSGGHHQPVVCLGGYVGDDGRRTRRRSWKLRRLLSRVAARDHGDVHRGDGR